MKFFRAAVIMCLLLGLAYFVQPTGAKAGPITPVENESYRVIEPGEKVVAVLPVNLILVSGSEQIHVKANSIGVSLNPALKLKVDRKKLEKSLDSLGIDSVKSISTILVSISRGASVVKVSTKQPIQSATPAPVKKPTTTVVPDYVPPSKPVSPATHTYTYCVAVRGVDPSNLPELQSKLASVYSDSRGWSLGGINTFVPVTTGCSLTVWLTAADQMPSFGAICDSMWSCTVYPNVILNFDRWRYASPAWNAAGGALDDYRTMVINHETGHWFGFGHRFCAGAGQSAPVMQQQSISLQGCAMNPWPLNFEKEAL